MSYRNLDFVSIIDTKRKFHEYCDMVGGIIDQMHTPEIRQLEMALHNISSASFKVLHPLFMRSYRTPRMKFRESPIRTVGLDIETDHTNGRPMLLGFWHPDMQTSYHAIQQPTLKTFFQYVRDMVENTGVSNLLTWGRLDIQCLIRLFNPDETERNRISRGIGVDWKQGKFTAKPPCVRKVGKVDFYIGHYIPGRSMKIGYVENGYNRTVWIFNCSQFWPNRIEDTAKGLNLEWESFDTEGTRDSHLVDWQRFNKDRVYQNRVLGSNRQDARTVWKLGEILQERFREVFDCYPSLLVSTGSITDAAVSKMLSDRRTEYESNSWRWLASNIWKHIKRPQMAEIETLLSEAFSGGYVDQFAIGYFPQIWAADIASAYPDKIRKLPDLRRAELFLNKGTLKTDLIEVRELGYDIETAIIRGKVEIPKSLKFHPITVKTYTRQNYRPTGKFYATYTLEERQFCEQYGAKFSDEQYVIVGLHERVDAPIARVSQKLGDFRAEIAAQINCPKDDMCDECKVRDSQQELIKIVDNSIYGKTVMTTETVEDVDGEPQITGYVAGDRFNLLYGTLITARTRIQIADACMKILSAGGRPIMTMTDSVCWQGTKDMLPSELVRKTKTFGYFESPQELHHFYVLKTGQYEYQMPDTKKWNYKVRGIPLDYDKFPKGDSSFFRRIIKTHCANISPGTHPKDIKIPVETRRLLSIGQRDLDSLGAIREGKTELKPFALSAKQKERTLIHWRECLDGAYFFETPHLKLDDSETAQYPLRWLHDEYVEGATERFGISSAKAAEISRQTSKTLDDRKKLYVWIASQLTAKTIPPGKYFRMSWSELESWFGLSRKTVLSEGKSK